MRLRKSIPSLATIAILGITPGMGAAEGEMDPEKLPPPAAGAVDFAKDIRPIFETSCYRCHGPERPKSGFRLDNRESALQGGELQKEDIVPGDSARSRLIYYVARQVVDLEMPPPGKGEPLTADQIGLLRKWIDDGAQWPEGEQRAGGKSTFEMTQFGRYVWVDGDKGKFREHTWMRERGAGGIEQFKFSDWLTPDVELSGDGRAFIDQDDYRIGLTLRKRDVGFIRGGYDTYRKYFDDSGGYYSSATLTLPPQSLGQDLSIDVSRAWVDLGLTRPNLPRVTIGYEYQQKEGDRALISWGAVQDPATFETKAIAPAAKAIEDQVHIFKLDADYTLGGWLLEDIFRAELYDVRTSRSYPDPFGPDVLTRNDESYRHFQAANAFRMERQFKDWLLGSAGYLFTHLDADAGFRQSVSSASGAFAPFDTDQSTQIILDQTSHTFNANAMLGPWEGLTLSAGGQVEWLRREGISDLVNPGFGVPFTTAFGSDLDKNAFQEDVGLRFTKIPFTVVYADLRFGQEWLDQYESGNVGDGIDDAQDFLRDTDARRYLQKYRGGFTISPWAAVSLDTSYEHRIQHNEYDHVLDTDGAQPPFAAPGAGYPAHILDHEFTTDEIEARLTWRILSWLKATLKYQWLEADYQTTTQAAPAGAPILYAGGSLLAGRQEADVYSAGLVLTPWRRLYLSPSFSYTDSEVRSAVDRTDLVAPYEGDIYSLLLTGNYILSRKLDLNATYAFSRADYAQDNQAGLPVGIEYTRHAVFGGLTHRIYKNLKMNYQYGYFRYDEPSGGGYNDYTAHAVLCSVNIAVP